MNSQNDKEGSGHVKAAVIGGIFALLAACVGGIFLILNTMINNGFIVFGMSNPSTSPTTNPNISNPSTNTPSFIASNFSYSSCDGYSWEYCWEINDSAQTMTWIGFTNGTGDIGQAGTALDKIRGGYKAFVTLDIELTINICSGTIDGVKLSGSCPKILLIPAGEHQIISPGESGGFIIYP